MHQKRHHQDGRASDRALLEDRAYGLKSTSFTWSDAALAFALALALDLLIGGRMLPGVLAGGLINPDSYMRLVRLDDILAKGSVLDTVMRDNSGRGTQLHWSHLVDSLLVLLSQPLTLFLAPRDALHAAAAAFGPLGMGALGVAVAWAAAPFAERHYLWLAPLTAGLSQSLVAYSIPGVVHHHVPLAVVVVMLGGWTARTLIQPSRKDCGLSLGLWSTIGLWFSPESMPFVLMSFGLVWLGWLSQPIAGASSIRSAGFLFLASVILVYAVDPPLGAARWMMALDRISVVHIAMAVATALAAFLTIPIDRLLPQIGLPRLIVGSSFGGLCVAAWVLAFPSLLAGPQGLLDDATAKAFFGGIAEMQPVRGFADTMTFMFTGILAAGFLVGSAMHYRLLPLAAGATCAVIVVGLGFHHIRFSSYAACLAAVVLPIAATLVTRYLRPKGEGTLALARVGLIALVVLVPRVGDIGATETLANPRGACSVVNATSMLVPHAGRVVLSDVDDVPELLYRTRIKTVGSLYHRSVDGFMRLRAAWRGPPTTDGLALLTAADVELVLHCARPRRSVLVADVQADTLLDALDQGRPPPWLREIGRSEVPGYTLYEVSR